LFVINIADKGLTLSGMKSNRKAFWKTSLLDKHVLKLGNHRYYKMSF